MKAASPDMYLRNVPRVAARARVRPRSALSGFRSSSTRSSPPVPYPTRVAPECLTRSLPCANHTQDFSSRSRNAQSASQNARTVEWHMSGSPALTNQSTADAMTEADLDLFLDQALNGTAHGQLHTSTAGGGGAGDIPAAASTHTPPLPGPGLWWDSEQMAIPGRRLYRPWVSPQNEEDRRDGIGVVGVGVGGVDGKVLDASMLPFLKAVEGGQWEEAAVLDGADTMVSEDMRVGFGLEEAGMMVDLLPEQGQHEHGKVTDQPSSLVEGPAPRGEFTQQQLLWLQVQREDRSHAEACEKYWKMMDDMLKFGKGGSLMPVQRMLLDWYEPLKRRIEEEQEAIWKKVPGKDISTYGPLLVLIKPDKLAVLVMHEVVNLCLTAGNKGISTLHACAHVAEVVQAEVNLLRLKNKLGKGKLSNLNNCGRKHIRQINRLAERALDSLDYADWPTAVRIKLGAALIKSLLETATRSEDGRPAFIHEIRSRQHKRRHGIVALDPSVYNKMMNEDVKYLVAPRFVPMLVEPRKWDNPDRGAYMRLRCGVMRTRGEKGQREALKMADLSQVYHGLNCLGKVRWRINTEILDVMSEAWDQGLEIGGMPSRTDLPVPETPEVYKEVLARGRKERAEAKKNLSAKGDAAGAGGKESVTSEEDVKRYKALRKEAIAHRRRVAKIQAKNSDMHSLRCDMQIKMSIAEEFRDHAFYFPYNMDFRGRTYPVPPNLSIVGSDQCRGVLRFEQAFPLGESGLYWLKVHLANLWGKDKLSMDDRVAFVDDSMDEIRDSADRPLDGNGWWIKADEPWQCLAVCKDLIRAIESPDPVLYQSSLPVHQDGSCNGLQHYSALGKDFAGGVQVNLVPSPKPQDVYSGVSKVVQEKVAADAHNLLPKDADPSLVKRQKYARMCDGLVDRKVVKQTVMTSVYGVTFVGARRQIQGQLEDKLVVAGQVLSEDEDNEIYQAASYLATLTMQVLEELFTEARNIMAWLTELSALVAAEGQPMAWVTPMGLPVVQPYRRQSKFQVQTLLQGVHLVEENENLPVSATRQRSAFPPNFVHSLDSTHMLLTAVEMEKRGIPFAAVHDSYWVHPGHVDEMSAALRQCFVDLYSQPILEDLHRSLCLRFPKVDFPPVPERGSLELKSVKDSKYFFH